MIELRSDVLAQIEELSTLVGDLVDLAREDAKHVIVEELDLVDIIERSLEQARRRRSDVDFVTTLVPWFVFGEEHGLSRAILNILDNAAKWSPRGHAVQVVLDQIDPTTVELTVADSGPHSGRGSSWCSSVSTDRRTPGRCPVPGWDWPSSGRWCSGTAAPSWPNSPKPAAH